MDNDRTWLLLTEIESSLKIDDFGVSEKEEIIDWQCKFYKLKENL